MWNCINELHGLINNIHQSNLGISIHMLHIKRWKWKFQMRMDPYQDHAHPPSQQIAVLSDADCNHYPLHPNQRLDHVHLRTQRFSQIPITFSVIANANCTWNNHPYNYLHALALNLINPQITCRSPQWIQPAGQTSSSLHLRQWFAGSL